jgi:integrase
MKGSLYKRCKCRDANGKEIGTSCPRLRRKDGSYAGHGTYYARLEAEPDPETGRRRTARKGGFARKPDAEAWLNEQRDKLGRGVDISRRLTVAEYLTEWIAAKSDIREATRISYSQHIRTLWIPQLGRYELSALRKAHVQSALDELDIAASSTQRYRATLRAALNDAKREGLVSVNVAELVKIQNGKRPKARVWTDARVLTFGAEYETRLSAARKRAANASAFKVWRDTSARPSKVMVWTPDHVGRFLDHAAEHRLYALYHLIAFRGLRRGEACGVRREALDLDAGMLEVNWQVSKPGGRIAEGLPKTEDSDAVVSLDRGTVDVLRAHLERQAVQRAEWGSAWVESGYVFTKEDGSVLDPEAVTDDFEHLAFEAGLPPIRLHDLRHSAASIMHLAGLDMKTISATLRHSTVGMTSDTYTSVFSDVDSAAAEATAAVVPRASEVAS